jgi:hypothetical protein
MVILVSVNPDAHRRDSSSYSVIVFEYNSSLPVHGDFCCSVTSKMQKLMCETLAHSELPMHGYKLRRNGEASEFARSLVALKKYSNSLYSRASIDFSVRTIALHGGSSEGAGSFSLFRWSWRFFWTTFAMLLWMARACRSCNKGRHTVCVS